MLLCYRKLKANKNKPEASKQANKLKEGYLI